MIQLDTWVEQISTWYKNRKHDQDEQLQTLILTVPDSVWGPEVTELQSKAIACWLDGCLRVFQGLRFQKPNQAYQYLQLATSKLQATVSQPLADLELKDWSMKRLQHLTVLGLEFCSQQEQDKWQRESNMLVESHVEFMAAHAWNEPNGNKLRNNDQGSVTLH
ncbi:transcriptional regulator [Vibrio sp. LaRot3]|uniref:transcriptional regulator n=1 Tax=Vibrio sp. LaRot3 TaxID=2998829 RepID=UPI0022CDCF7E|nr:transcriptional regulator [Vibrio sp. LaRot3]MDA0149832.1 transcriptional regulator [Vibrio sp. LaRot3]